MRRQRRHRRRKRNVSRVAESSDKISRPTNYTARCSTLSTLDALITYSCLVSLAAPTRPASQTVVSDLHGRLPRGTSAAGVHELLNSSYLLLKSRTVRAWCGAVPEGIRSRHTPQRAERHVTGARDDRGSSVVGFRVLSLAWPLAIIYYAPSGCEGNTKIFVRDYDEPAERSIWYARASWRQCAVMRHGVLD